MTDLWIALGTLAGIGVLIGTVWLVILKWRELSLSKARTERETTPRLSVRLGGGFQGDEHRVTIHAVVGNDGGTTARGVVVDALIDGHAVASSAPVDVAPGGVETVDIDIPRQYVVHLHGERPIYTGEFSLRATGKNGATATPD